MTGGEHRIIALDGPDNVGKTSQLRLLTIDAVGGLATAGPVHRYDRDWPAGTAGELSRWWFETSTTEELNSRLLTAYRQRAEAVRDAPVAVLDRGLTSIGAACVATAMMKDSTDYEKAQDAFLEQRADALRGLPAEDASIRLTHGVDLEDSLAISLAREPATDARYREYQRLLQTCLDRGPCENNVHIAAGDSMIDVGNRIRAVLRTQGIAVHDLLSDLRLCIGLAGMSESGKSTVGEHLRRSRGAGRLKLRHLVDLAAARRDVADPYGTDPAELAAWVVAELHDFSAAHYYIQDFSLESLHRADLTRELKRLMGDRFQVVFVDAPESKRRTRSLVDADSLRTNDAVKRSRGAEHLRAAADHVLDNSGDLVQLTAAVDALHNGLRWAADRRSIVVRPVAALRAPTEYLEAAETVQDRLVAALPEQLLMFAVVGSVGFGTTDPGRSDLDVLVVTEAGHTRSASDSLEQLRTGLPVKLGLTVLSRAELSSGLLDTRTLSNVFHILTGDLAVQLLAGDLVLPDLEPADQAAATRRYLARSLHELRRSLWHRSQDPDGLYKTVLNVLKMILRLDGTSLSDHDQIRAEFRRVFGPGVPWLGSRQDFLHLDQNVLRESLVALVSWLESHLAGPQPSVPHRQEAIS